MSKWGLHQCVGAIDSTHIPSIAPNDSPLDYYNRKKRVPLSRIAGTCWPQMQIGVHWWVTMWREGGYCRLRYSVLPCAAEHLTYQHSRICVSLPPPIVPASPPAQFSLQLFTFMVFFTFTIFVVFYYLFLGPATASSLLEGPGNATCLPDLPHVCYHYHCFKFWRTRLIRLKLLLCLYFVLRALIFIASGLERICTLASCSKWFWTPSHSWSFRVEPVQFALVPP